MKRKALLFISGCTVKAFEGYKSRDLLPVMIRGYNWSDYTLDDAIKMRVMVEGVKSMDAASAHELARRCLHAVHPIHPLYHTDNEELWVGLVRYDWPNAPDEDWKFSQVVGGRWEDLESKAQAFVKSLDNTANVVSIHALSLTRAAMDVYMEAQDLGIAEGEPENRPQTPEKLDHFPDWFVEKTLSLRKFWAQWEAEAKEDEAAEAQEDEDGEE